MASSSFGLGEFILAKTMTEFTKNALKNFSGVTYFSGSRPQ